MNYMNTAWKHGFSALLSIFILAVMPAILMAQQGLQESSRPASKSDDAFFETLFKNNAGKFDSAALHRIGWNVQVIYTQINRDKSNAPTLQSYYYNKKDATYFYPAAAVNLAIAVLALQKLHSIGKPEINLYTTMITDMGYAGQTPVYNDPNTPDGRPTIAGYIKRMLLVNDTSAYDRLYEFLGQQYINDELHAHGYPEAQLLNRMNAAYDEATNRRTNPISFYGDRRQLLYTQQLQSNEQLYAKREDYIGNGYIANTTLLNQPMNFSQMNKFPLDGLNNILLSVLFPASVKSQQRFSLTDDDRRFLLKYISAYLSESTFPFYDSNYTSTFSKYNLPQKGFLPAAKNIRVFNSGGVAFSQLTDVAYVADFDRKIEFMVSATIYCNGDGILNDGKDEIETIAIPFLQNLRKALYDYELKRKRNTLPDLSPMIFPYDK